MNDSYKAAFGAEVASEALRYALDIRKFEIELLWRRAAYFWTLIAATFAGYFAVLTLAASETRDFNAYVLSCVGLTFSVAWFLTNRGSKFWQENWEAHVDLLEDRVTGPLYKTVLHERRTRDSLLSWLEGPAPYSVSSINQWTSLFIIAIWGTLAFEVLPDFDVRAGVSCRHALVTAITVAAIALMLFRGKSRIVNGPKRFSSAVRVSSANAESSQAS